MCYIKYCLCVFVTWRKVKYIAGEDYYNDVWREKIVWSGKEYREKKK